MINYNPLEITDFTGGITDYFVDGRPNQGERMDNFFFTNHQKLITRWGSEVFVPAQLPSGTFRVSLMDFLRDTQQNTEQLLVFSARKLYTETNPTWTEILGPTGGDLFDQGDDNSFVSKSEYQSILFVGNSDFSSIQKIYFDENGVIQARNAGLPEIPSGTTVAPAPGSGSTYSYAIVLRFSYQVGDTLYLDRGPVSFVPTIVSGGVIGSGNAAVVTLPTTFPNPENWDFSNIQIEIYRTLDGGTDYFLSGTVPFGTATYNDIIEDGTINSQGGLYGSNGAVSNGTPPKSKYVHVVNNTGYYAHTKSGTLINKYSVFQSIPGDPDSVPANFFEETEQEIFGLSSIYDRPIVLCRNYIYRIDQFIASDGTGLLDLRRIDDRAGCVSNNSIVQTHKGLFWAGEVGFYWTDGFKVQKISDGINETYRELVSNVARAERIQGTYDPNHERVIWSVSNTDVDNEVDTCFVLDLRFGVRPDSTFTTMSGGDSFRPTAVQFHKDPQSRELRVYRGDSRGFVFYHQEGLFSDPRIDLLETNTANWVEQAIIYDYKSSFLDFGSKFFRKFVPRILISAENTTNLSLAISSSNDSNRITGDLCPIRYRDNVVWGDSLPLWGDPDATWNAMGIIEQWRRFPAKSLRCQYKQVRFTNDENAQIVNSDLIGQVTLNRDLRTATLTGSFQFPTGVEDYFLTFENDGYENKFKILTRAPTTLVLEDDFDDLPPSGMYRFIMKGAPKNEILILNGYVLHWAPLSKSHTPFTASSLGGTPSE